MHRATINYNIIVDVTQLTVKNVVPQLTIITLWQQSNLHCDVQIAIIIQNNIVTIMQIIKQQSIILLKALVIVCLC